MKNSISFFCFIMFSLMTNGQTKNLVLKYKVKNSSFTKEYYWVIPDSTIGKKGRFEAYPMYFDFFSKNNFESCVNGNSVNLFESKEGVTYNFAELQLKQFELIRSFIKNKGVVVQKLRKSKKNSVYSREKVTISIIPIEGKFVYCNTNAKMVETINYKGEIAIPFSDFKLDMAYYNSEKVSDLIFYADFSLIDYYNDIE